MTWSPAEVHNSVAVGELMPNFECKLVDDDGLSEVAAGGAGEIVVRGPAVMKGYWRNAKATRDCLSEDGWLRTGDIAYVDEAGKFFLVDRKKVCGGGLPCPASPLTQARN